MTTVDPPNPEVAQDPGSRPESVSTRRRALVQTQEPPRRRSEQAQPYRVKAAGMAPRLRRRPWRGVKVALGLVLLLAVGMFAAVQGVRTLAGVVLTDEHVGLDSYAAGDSGVDVIDEDAGFSAVFPTRPSRDIPPVPGTDGNEVATALVSETEGTEVSVLWFDLDGDVEDPPAVLSFVAGVTAVDLEGDLDDQLMLASSPVPAHEFVVVNDDGAHLIRHMLVDGTVFELRVSSEARMRDVFNRLVDSFVLLGGPTA